MAASEEWYMRTGCLIFGLALLFWGQGIFFIFILLKNKLVTCLNIFILNKEPLIYNCWIFILLEKLC